ncbi:MAG: hypothetical protein K2X35_16915 [Bryobacteraceae bacterium]|nr:hypothetical protein [Bryobacteraceae bacterium]
MDDKNQRIDEMFRDGKAILAAMELAYYSAVLKHRAAGVPMVFGKNGKVIHVDANEIEIPPEILARLRP